MERNRGQKNQEKQWVQLDDENVELNSRRSTKDRTVGHKGNGFLPIGRIK